MPSLPSIGDTELSSESSSPLSTSMLNSSSTSWPYPGSSGPSSSPTPPPPTVTPCASRTDSSTRTPTGLSSGRPPIIRSFTGTTNQSTSSAAYIFCSVAAMLNVKPMATSTSGGGVPPPPVLGQRSATTTQPAQPTVYPTNFTFTFTLTLMFTFTLTLTFASAFTLTFTLTFTSHPDVHNLGLHTLI
ncbi:hypothetical protein F5878DRAFT_681395 [Lentinula raphanica]|uniref:Uncharacterized protein n=1 Tax=Lentinula raphanica TaxID=153919 RepID=A0AA38UEG9_9AGAR|nr:hypothetical protein F5878DRAFT_681395 [Lentinula raphanica]